jgi:uncharacterized protein YutE (UPF0331/DUF86 family)
MVDREELTKYIQDLEGYLEHLAELQRYSKPEFLADWRIHDLADRQLHLALETSLTIGEAVISGCGFRRPNTYADIPKILCQNKVIGQQLSDQLVNLARFRNVLVHDYLALDHERVYQHVHADGVIIREFIDAVRNFVAEQPLGPDSGS